jgi:hypothetical protein
MSGRRSHAGHAGECSREPAIDGVFPRRIRCVDPGTNWTPPRQCRRRLRWVVRSVFRCAEWEVFVEARGIVADVQRRQVREHMSAIEARRSEGKIEGIGTAYPEISVCTWGCGAPRGAVAVSGLSAILLSINKFCRVMCDGPRWSTPERKHV